MDILGGPEKLRIHEISHKTNGEALACKLCEKTFLKVWELKKHERNHADIRPYSCRFCTLTFKLSTHAKRHEVVHVTKGKDVSRYGQTNTH